MNSQVLRRNVDLLFLLTKKDTSIRYKNSVFGYLWAICNPLCFAFIYYIVFKVVMKVQIENYTVFLLSALFAWQWASNSIINNLNVYSSNTQIIKKTVFPKYFLLLSNILMETIHFIITIPVIILFLFIYNIQLSTEWFYGVPLLLISQIILIFSISLLFSSLNVFFRDIERIVQLSMMVLFYLTPVLYNIDMVPSEYSSLVLFNPFTYQILNWRSLFLYGDFNLLYMIYSLSYSALILFIAVVVYNKVKYKFAEVL